MCHEGKGMKREGHVRMVAAKKQPLLSNKSHLHAICYMRVGAHIPPIDPSPQTPTRGLTDLETLALAMAAATLGNSWRPLEEV